MDEQKPEETQSGTKLAIGIAVFMVGLIVLLVLMKYLFNM